MERFNNHIVLQLEQLRVLRDDIIILKTVDMIIEHNDIVALVGPTGHGKSILLRAINRLFSNDGDYEIQGRILLENVSTDTIVIAKLRQKIGMVFSAPNLFPMSIYENVAFGLRLIGVTEKKALDSQIRNVLLKVNLWNDVRLKLNQSINKLTIEQQQRLCLARTLALQPKVILMDKPTLKLSSSQKSRFESLILQLKKKYTIIVTAEDRQQAGRISNKVAFFYNGRLIEYETTNRIFTHPKEELTENYITGRLTY